MGCAASVPPDSHSLRWELKRCLGHGQSSQVFLAKDKLAPPGSPWRAVKFITKSHASAHIWFEQEISILRQLLPTSINIHLDTFESKAAAPPKTAARAPQSTPHPNIVNMFEVYETSTDYVIVMEWLTGEQLFGEVMRLTNYTEKEASGMAKQMLHALLYCHQHDIVHRDLKPANFVFSAKDPSATLKMIDFGLALHLRDTDIHTDDVGTPYYMAPELVDDHSKEPHTGKVLKASDIWAMGVIIYMMLTGQPPFLGNSDEMIMDLIVIGDFTWPEEPVVSASARDLVESMLRLHHHKRITAAEALKHPWIQGAAASNKSLQSAKSSLQQFSAETLMKKAVSALLLKEFGEGDVNKLRHSFMELDIDGDRLLNERELAVYMSQHGFEDPKNARAAASLFIRSSAEMKERRGVNYLEFENAHLRGQLGPDAASIRRAFDALDAEKCGFLLVDKFKQSVNVDVFDTIMELIQDVSPIADGKITFDIFFAAITSELLKQTIGKSRSRLRGFMSSARRSIVSHASSATSNSSVRLNSFASSSQIQLSPASVKAYGGHLVPPISVNPALMSGGMGCCASKPAVTRAVWGRFRRISILGQGASCQVWLCADKQAKSPDVSMVAVKLIPKSFKYCKLVYDHETSILNDLKHPNIVPLLDAFETQEDYVLVAKYLRGGVMMNRLRALHHYSERVASLIGKKMLQAILFCHKHNIVHRDLKPDNFVFSSPQSDSELMLIDFGEALKIADNEVDQHCVGTPYYIAPEIVDTRFVFPHTGKVLKASDMWSIGVIFYVMLCGCAPFMGRTDEDIFDRIISGEYTWPSAVKVSDQAKDLVSKMLTLDHTKRITAAEALNHPWIANHESNSDVSLNDALKALKDFSTAALMKKAVANILIKEMTEEETSKLRQLFDELDTDGDRYLDVQELAVYMKHHGYEKDEDAVAAAEAFVKAASESNSGVITFLEFENAHMRGQLGSDAVAIRKAFDAIDADKSGYIDIKDLMSLLGDDAFAMFQDLIKESKEQSQSKISFQTFFSAMTKGDLKQAAGRSVARLRGFLTSSRHSVSVAPSQEAVVSADRSKKSARRCTTVGGLSVASRSGHRNRDIDSIMIE